MVMIRLVSDGSGNKEWVVFELQGTIESTDKSQPLSTLGTLSLAQPDTPMLTVGHHQLLGKVVALKKPLVVCESAPAQESRELRVIGVVRKKFLFKTRPRPVVS
eukprot:c12553_g1_i2.p1 GENE.c12553_g1_i2~~c12553_g1_i2.p1  ORF type:complete len:118 (+),score=13.72 c12553_g1_i2:45-356(+)